MSVPDSSSPVASPCTSVCTMDPASGFCAGCFRTLNEIAAWSALSDTDKEKIFGGNAKALLKL